MNGGREGGKRCMEGGREDERGRGEGCLVAYSN